MSREAARIVAAGNKIPPQAERKAARTCKKLPVASFCTSERVFAVLFARRKKYQSVPLTGSSRFSKPRFSSPQPHLPTATIKTFLRESRGSANLESAHKNNNFAQSNEILLPPLAAIFSACGGVPLREHSRFCKPRFSAPQPRCAFPWRRLCIDIAPEI